MENNQKQNHAQHHTFTLENQSRALITGVQEVVSATEKGVYLKLANCGMQLVGEGLRVEKLSPEEKVLIVVGKIYDVKYSHTASKSGFLKKLFR